jgi:hypothetical protein
VSLSARKFAPALHPSYGPVYRFLAAFFLAVFFFVIFFVAFLAVFFAAAYFVILAVFFLAVFFSADFFFGDVFFAVFFFTAFFFAAFFAGFYLAVLIVLAGLFDAGTVAGFLRGGKVPDAEVSPPVAAASQNRSSGDFSSGPMM